MLSNNNISKLNRIIKLLENSSKSSVTVRKKSTEIWTQDKIVKSPYEKIEIPNCTLYDYVWQNLEKWPQRTLSVCAMTGRGYTYEQGFKLSNTFAAQLRKKFHIRDGDTVAVMLPNVPDFPIVAMGILEAGGVITSINPLYTAYEVQRQLLLSDTKIVVTLPELSNVVKDALKIAKLNIPIIVIRTRQEPVPEGTVLFNELTEDIGVDTSCLKEVRRSTKDICFLPYSSGTTGLPKGVELSNRNLVANCEQSNDPKLRCFNETTKSHQDAQMCVLPFFHIYGAVVCMFHKMSQGIKLVSLAKFQPIPFLEALQKYKTNLLFAAPPMVLMMTSHPAATPQNLQYLETVINGAAPLSATDAERFFKKANRKLDFRQGYGLTETSPIVCITPKGLENYSCVGHPINNTEIKIVDNDLNNLGPNETGELLVRGPQVMRGYRDDPKANSEAFTVNGWFRTGDLAIIDDDGFVTISDRLKELIKVKGFQVAPAELEAVLREHPAVEDAGVVGIPHPTNGEAPKAFVVLKKGQMAGAREISDFVKNKVAPFKSIEEIVFIDTIPKSLSGKILRRELKEKYC